MATQAELDAVADVLADEDNRYLSAGQVAEKVLGALAQLRRRPWRYVVITQNRAPKWYEVTVKTGLKYQRRFFPTYAKGPFSTKAEAASAAGRDRRRLRDRLKVHVMTVELFDPETEVDPDSLKEVLA